MKHSLETKQKISESMKGNKNRLGKTFSEETLQKRFKINKDKKVYNNGERNIFLMIGQEVPDGFVEGVLITESDRQSRSERMKKLNKEKWERWRQEHGGCSFTDFDK